MARACTDSAIRGLESDVAALESYRDVLEQQANDWINDALDFPLPNLSTPFEMAQDVVNNVTTTNLGCDEDQVPVVQDYVQDCLNKIRGEVTRKLKNLDSDLGGAALSEMTVAERFLSASMSDLFALFERYSLNRLLDAINRNMNCITSSSDAEKYVAEIDNMNDRIDQVIDDLPIDDSGDFDFNKLTEDLDSGLTENLDIYKTRSSAIATTSKENMANQLAEIGDVNPANRF